MKVTYELHAQSKGRWYIERVLSGGTKEAALDAARHLYAEPQISGVKVVCEKYNPDTNDSSEVVVYDTTKGIGEKVALKEKPKTAPATNGASAAKPATGKSKGRSAPGKKKAAAKKSQSMAGIAVLSVVMVTAIAVLVIALSRGAEVLGSL